MSYPNTVAIYATNRLIEVLELGSFARTDRSCIVEACHTCSRPLLSREARACCPKCGRKPTILKGWNDEERSRENYGRRLWRGGLSYIVSTNPQTLAVSLIPVTGL